MFTYKKFKLSAAIVALSLVVCGCIRNDIPYPRLQAGFASFVAEGTTQAASIDSIARTVTVFLDESSDIRSVRVSSFVLTPDGAVWADSAAFSEGVDLREPVRTTVSLYQDYRWTISATQTIERYFTIEGQLGASTIDVPGRRIIVDIPEHQNVKTLRVTSMKLAGPDAVYDPELVDQITDFSHPVEINVTEHGRTETWKVYVQISASSVTLERVDAWTKVAWLYGSAQEGKNNRFQYRRSDSDTWLDVPDADVTHDGGTFSVCLKHLDPLTTYTARALSDDEASNEIDFTTDDVYYIPNGSMDDWWLDGKVWCPWIEGGTPYWGTGNKGATTLGSSNSYPTDDTSTGTGQAACLETRFVGIGVIGKLAAGNLFAGDYIRTEGTNGVLSFGRPFSQRPTALKGYFKYKTAPISSVSAGFENLKGQPDSCVVWCALIDSDAPFEIRTNPANRHLFDPNASDVVAYGIMEVGYNVDNYIPFEVSLSYRSTSRRPKYVLLVASASKYGDYFTGGAGATLWIDNLSFEFDY